MGRACGEEFVLNPRLEYVATTASTNGDLLARLAAGEAVGEGTWLIADKQTAGRGRRGRAWADGQGNLMASTVVALAASDPPAHSLALVAAIALYDTIYDSLSGPVSDAELMIKWPNDILLAGAKLAGILLERSGQHVVVGFGVNLAYAPAVEGRATCALADYVSTLDSTPTSALTSALPTRDVFASALAQRVAVVLADWRRLPLSETIAAWCARAHPLGTILQLAEGQSGDIQQGTFAGLAADGALRLHDSNGREILIHGGDVDILAEIDSGDSHATRG